MYAKVIWWKELNKESYIIGATFINDTLFYNSQHLSCWWKSHLKITILMLIDESRLKVLGHVLCRIRRNKLLAREEVALEDLDPGCQRYGKMTRRLVHGTSTLNWSWAIGIWSYLHQLDRKEINGLWFSTYLLRWMKNS